MGISGRIARYFQDSQLTPLAALVALLLGVFAVLVTPREEEPQIDVTMVNVFVPFPGAAVRELLRLARGRTQRTGPLGPRTRAVYHRIECSPCLERTCRFGHYECLKRVTADEVEGALVELGALR